MPNGWGTSRSKLCTRWWLWY